MRKILHWVEKEWRCAMNQRGIDIIYPIPLVDPAIVKPPVELREHVHFDNWSRIYRDYYTRTSEKILKSILDIRPSKYC
jgi:hypothetical protein